MHFGLALIAAASAQDTTTRTLPALMPALSIQGGRTHITIRHDPGAASSQVTVVPTNWWEGCEVAFSGNRREAVMAIQEEGELASRACTADIELVLAGTARRGSCECG